MTLISRKVEKLKKDIISEKLSYEEIFQKHIVDGNSYFFQSYLNDLSEEYKIKSLIAEYIGVHIHEVIIVGSAKLGFSLSPNKLFNKFDFKFETTKLRKDKSDLDIAIISNKLFERVSKNIFDYTDSFTNKWTENEYYFGARANQFHVPICYKYFEYFSKGWFRPDMKPRGYDFCEINSYEDIKRIVFNKFQRKMALGIYQDWHYFKHYHIRNLKDLSYVVKTDVL